MVLKGNESYKDELDLNKETKRGSLFIYDNKVVQ